jgi:hypothetical protein
MTWRFASARFWLISTNVERKIASRETTRVSVGHGLRSRTSIHRPKAAAWMYTNGIDPANVVMASAIFSCTSSARCLRSAAVTGWTRGTGSRVEAMSSIWGIGSGGA